ncbi:hypothetical protein GALL_452280 [mine drainage metagenome]|uniref:Uncharacterized protein n=1 Tax=mine drainage metagenome TaxID=410659 RepID=A0A1J5PZ94_9ZZZZ
MLRWSLGAKSDPPLLKVDEPRPVVITDANVRLDALIAHWKQLDSKIPSLGQCGSHVGQGVAGIEHLGADQVRCHIAIAEAEPTWASTKASKLSFGIETLFCASPAVLFIDYSTQRVHDRVQVGADAQSMESYVVAGVGNDRDLGVGGGIAQSTQEAGATGAPREGEYPLHIRISKRNSALTDHCGRNVRFIRQVRRERVDLRE